MWGISGTCYVDGCQNPVIAKCNGGALVCGCFRMVKCDHKMCAEHKSKNCMMVPGRKADRRRGFKVSACKDHEDQA